MPEAGQFHCLLVEFLAEQSGNSQTGLLGLLYPPLTLTPPPEPRREIRAPRRAPETNGGGEGRGAGEWGSRERPGKK